MKYDFDIGDVRLGGKSKKKFLENWAKANEEESEGLPKLRKECSGASWINYSYHCQEIAALEEENKKLKERALEAEKEAQYLAKHLLNTLRLLINKMLF